MVEARKKFPPESSLNAAVLPVGLFQINKNNAQYIASSGTASFKHSLLQRRKKNPLQKCGDVQVPNSCDANVASLKVSKLTKCSKKEREIEAMEVGEGRVGGDIRGPFQSISPLIFLVKQSN